MANEFYIDYDGSGSAAARFATKGAELDLAAAQGAEGSATGMHGPMGAGTAPVQSAADDILVALGGRLRVFSAELLALSTLVNNTIQVTNEIDVEYQL
ncbi:hypothetical protein [Nocardioides pelophilus]|uniref:hypothetical protein n=1 Tax=Nocardioides pelophilus TaxID=2172019 RepID=UPI001603CDE9|nr:hypothetical protein [Nocardioides pelophilus]